MSATAPALALSRRHFLKLTALVGGGLLISCGSSVPLDDETPPPPGADTALGDFLRIGADNRITVLVGSTEIGQGILTGIAMAVAEELDADWNLVGAEHSPVALRYGNPYYTGALQATVGSSSMRGYYRPQREMGALVRRLLVETAAARWQVDAALLVTENSHVIDVAGGRRLSYGELAADAATRRMPRTAPLKAASEFRVIGTPRQRLDAQAQVDGSRVYGIDFEIPGMLTAVVARPPRFYGQVLSYDDSATLAVPGVREVHRTAIGVVVVADNYWAAEQGRKALAVQWIETLAGRTDSVQQRERYRNLLALPGIPSRVDGVVATAQLLAAEVLQADYHFPFQAHAPMEPLNVVIDYDGRRARIWTGSQSPTLDRLYACAVLGLLPNQIEFNVLPAGGGFGRRGSFLGDFVRDACQVARAVRKPLKLIWSREDDMRGGSYRPMAAVRVGAALDANGRISAWTHRSVNQDITAAAPAETLLDAVAALNNGERPPLHELTRLDQTFPYAVRNLRTDFHLDALPLMPAQFMRAVNKYTDVFAQESFLDEVAQRAGREPYQLRRELLAEQPRLLAVLEAAATAAGWSSPLPAPQDGEGRRARGIAAMGHWNSHIAQVVELSVDDEKRIILHRVVSAVDCGTIVNPDLVRAQIESAVVFALTSLFYGEITLVDGVVQQGNFDDYRLLRMYETPDIETVLIASNETPGGVGELGVSCVGPALANAIFAATGAAIRELPLKNLGYRLGERHAAAGVVA